MDKLKGAKYFTKLDVRWGYNNIQIKKGDEWKAAFKTNKGLFEPTVMFFGMCNSPTTLQAMMDDIFMTMIDGQLVIVYMDNIFIFCQHQGRTGKDYLNGTGKTTGTRPISYRDCHGQPRSFLEQPVPVPVKNRARSHALGAGSFFCV